MPLWWDTFTAHLQTHRHTFYAADAITHTARLIFDAGTTDPDTLVDRAQHAIPWLVRTLTDFFRTHHLHDALSKMAEDVKAAVLRERRIEAVPLPLRPACDRPVWCQWGGVSDGSSVGCVCAGGVIWSLVRH
ncbi:hypothetical protein [Streptomyces sp. NPDC054854]